MSFFLFLILFYIKADEYVYPYNFQKLDHRVNETLMYSFKDNYEVVFNHPEKNQLFYLHFKIAPKEFNSCFKYNREIKKGGNVIGQSWICVHNCVNLETGDKLGEDNWDMVIPNNMIEKISYSEFFYYFQAEIEGTGLILNFYFKDEDENLNNPNFKTSISRLNKRSENKKSIRNMAKVIPTITENRNSGFYERIEGRERNEVEKLVKAYSNDHEKIDVRNEYWRRIHTFPVYMEVLKAPTKKEDELKDKKPNKESEKTKVYGNGNQNSNNNPEVNNNTTTIVQPEPNDNFNTYSILDDFDDWNLFEQYRDCERRGTNTPEFLNFQRYLNLRPEKKKKIENLCSFFGNEEDEKRLMDQNRLVADQEYLIKKPQVTQIDSPSRINTGERGKTSLQKNEGDKTSNLDAEVDEEDESEAESSDSESDDREKNNDFRENNLEENNSEGDSSKLFLIFLFLIFSIIGILLVYIIKNKNIETGPKKKQLEKIDDEKNEVDYNENNGNYYF